MRRHLTCNSLSAYLYEETQNVTYQQAAQLSLDFIVNHMWNGSIVYDSLILDSCEFRARPFSADQGWFVEGEGLIDGLVLPVDY